MRHALFRLDAENRMMLRSHGYVDFEPREGEYVATVPDHFPYEPEDFYLDTDTGEMIEIIHPIPTVREKVEEQSEGARAEVITKAETWKEDQDGGRDSRRTATLR